MFPRVSGTFVWPRFLMVFLATLILCGSASWSSGQSAETPLPTIKEIERAWQLRADRIQTLTCEWTEQEFVPAHSRTVQLIPSLREGTAPANDLQFSSDCLLQIGTDDRFRYERKGKQFVERLNNYEERHLIAVTDGVQSRSFHGEDQTGDNRFAPLGFVRPNPVVFEMLDLQVGGAILVYCRPTAQAVANICSLRNARVVGWENVGGVRCVAVEHGEAMHQTRIYFDPEREWIPLRLVRRSQDKLGTPFDLFRLDFFYDRDPDQSVRLVGWTLESARSAEQLVHRSTATVTRFDVNAKIDSSAFVLEFPAGTKVHDSGADETYLVRADGSKRPITLGEVAAFVPYDTLINTEPREFPLEEGNRRSVWTIGVLIALCVGVLSWWFLSRRSQRGVA